MLQGRGNWAGSDQLKLSSICCSAGEALSDPLGHLKLWDGNL